jgi:hypothetical protein
MFVSEFWNDMFKAGPGEAKFEVVDSYGDVYEATVIDVHRRARDPWGEAFQGEEECYIIFQTDDGRFFKKTGYESSYDENDIDWDDEYYVVREVFGEVKTVTTFVPKGN